MNIMTKRNNLSYFRKCPYNCANPTYINPSKLVKRAIKELKIICTQCKQIFTLEQIDAHINQCMRLKCGCLDCEIPEDNMKKSYKVNL